MYIRTGQLRPQGSIKSMTKGSLRPGERSLLSKASALKSGFLLRHAIGLVNRIQSSGP